MVRFTDSIYSSNLPHAHSKQPCRLTPSLHLQGLNRRRSGIGIEARHFARMEHRYIYLRLLVAVHVRILSFFLSGRYCCVGRVAW